jgi:hypothetical protein
MSDTVSPILDKTNSLSSSNAKKMGAGFSAFEELTGWKFTVLTLASMKFKHYVDALSV